MTIVDTNILVDILTNNPTWMSWSADRLDECSRAGPLIINDVIYAEVSIGFEDESVLKSRLEIMGLTHEQFPASALFLAGKVYRRYRAMRGRKANVLPDFFIGAHAAVTRIPLLTRDLRRYRTYFPDITLITP